MKWLKGFERKSEEDCRPSDLRFEIEFGQTVLQSQGKENVAQVTPRLPIKIVDRHNFCWLEDDRDEVLSQFLPHGRNPVGLS